MNWPKHKCSLTLSHNQHKDYYNTVADEIDGGLYAHVDWVSDEQKAKAIATDDCWTLQWYPITPIGFHLLGAADLDVLMTAAMAVDGAE